MSDKNEEAFEAIMADIVMSYGAMGHVFSHLPVPVQFPRGEINAADARDAVIRAAQIAQDQPMPEEQQILMERTALLWLAAFEMAALFQRAPEPFRAGAAVHCIMGSDQAMISLGEWLLGQEPDDE